jgi:hypothetical protein
MTDLGSQPFASLDPDLPSIAARAAVEVDAIINAKNVGAVNLARLADVMTRAFGGESATTGAAARFLDPIETDVMYRTFQDARPRDLNSYDALRAASLDLAKRLRETTSPGTPPALEDLKRFCLALSKHALATTYSRDESVGARTHKR